MTSSWQVALTKRLASLESSFDALRTALRSQFGSHRAPVIQPYIGHTNRDRLLLRGRVLFDANIQPPTEADSRWTNFKNTYRRFDSSEIPYARVRATIGPYTQEVTCDDEGFFMVELALQDALTDDNWQQVMLQVIDTPVNGLDTQSAVAKGQIATPARDAQFAVVSDLDDTVVQTDVLNVFRMLSNTIFYNAHTRLPFEGVPEFYQALRQGTHNTFNPIFYVSSSPWNLYDVIVDFYRVRNIPLGPIYLRNLGLSAHGRTPPDHLDHKLDYILRLIALYQDLPFILIGDSGQKDPLIYREVVSRHPNRVQAVYIRDVQRPDRARATEQIAEQVRDMGVDMLLVADTAAAAKHAAARGWITQEAAEQIQRACGC
jgi:phosphatidate phosphatase APP1